MVVLKNWYRWQLNKNIGVEYFHPQVLNLYNTPCKKDYQAYRHIWSCYLNMPQHTCTCIVQRELEITTITMHTYLGWQVVSFGSASGRGENSRGRLESLNASSLPRVSDWVRRSTLRSCTHSSSEYCASILLQVSFRLIPIILPSIEAQGRFFSILEIWSEKWGAQLQMIQVNTLLVNIT